MTQREKDRAKAGKAFDRTGRQVDVMPAYIAGYADAAQATREAIAAALRDEYDLPGLAVAVSAGELG